MWLALKDVVLARWTDDIHDEWVRSVLRDRPDLKPEQLQRTREMMNTHVRDCRVTGYRDLITALQLPDPDDRHVLAAAIKAGASVIVTYNTKHFPAEASTPSESRPSTPTISSSTSSTSTKLMSVTLSGFKERTSRTHRNPFKSCSTPSPRSNYLPSLSDYANSRICSDGRRNFAAHGRARIPHRIRAPKYDTAPRICKREGSGSTGPGVI